MGHIQDSLIPNEKILFAARVHPAVFLPSVFSFAISIGFFAHALSMGSKNDVALGLLAAFLWPAATGFFLHSILLGIQALIVLLTTEFVVTNKRVIAKGGFIRRCTLEILLSKVESISVNQNVLGRLLNFGTVTVTGTGGTRGSFSAIAEPVEVRKRIIYIIERYAQPYAQSEQQVASRRTSS